jgi:hypothetical protein
MNDGFASFLPYLAGIVGGGFILGMSGILASIHNTRLKVRNGYPLEGMWGQKLTPQITSDAMERVKLLVQENAALRAEVGSMKDRVAVVERIVTDKGFDVSHQIERLREATPRLSDKAKN